MKAKITPILSCFAAAISLAGSAYGAPTLESISIAPAVVDLTSGTASATVTVQLSTPGGLDYCSVELLDPAGANGGYAEIESANRIAGDDESGTYQAPITFLPHHPGGVWTVELYLDDLDGNSAYHGTGGLAFPPPGTPTLNVVNNGPIDSAPPVLQSLIFSPQTVDLSTGAQQVTVTVDITDDVGFESLGFSLRAPSGLSPINFRGSPQRTDGATQDGTYQIQITVPAGAEPGSWIPRLILKDVAGREIFYGSEHAGDTPLPDTSHTALEVTRTNNTAPVLTNFTISPSTVDVSSGGQWVTLHIEAEDDNGIDRFGVSFDVPDRSLGWQIGQSDRIAGDAQSGTYERDVLIPPFLPPGDYPAEVILFDDQNLASVYYSHDLPLPAASTTSLSLVNNGAVDTTQPVLTSLQFEPAVIEPSTDPVAVTVTLTATDDLAGVSHGGITFFTPDGSYLTQGSYGEFERTAGDGLSSTYSFDVIFPSVPAGPLDLQSDLSVIDAGELRVLYGDRPGGTAYPAGTVALSIADKAPPSVDGLIITPDMVDVSAGSQNLTITAQASDPSGVSRVYLRLGGTERSLEWSLDAGNRISGDALSGTYQLQISLPRFLPPGQLALTAEPTDALGNRGSYGPAGSGFPAGSTDAVTIINTSQADTVPPALEALHFEPTVVAPSDTPVTISVTIIASDATSGLSGGGITFFSGNEFIRAKSFTAADLVEGDAHSGTYTFDVTLPRIPGDAPLSADVILRDASKLFSRHGSGGGRTPFPSGTLPLLVSENPPDAYDIWLAAYPQLTDAARDFGSDPDHDGLTNGIEFVIGTDPTHPDPASDKAPSPVLLPDRYGIWVDISNENLNLGSGSTVTFGAEASTDMVNWIPVPISDTDGLTNAYYVSRADQRRIFLRFTATPPAGND